MVFAFYLKTFYLRESRKKQKKSNERHLMDHFKYHLCFNEFFCLFLCSFCFFVPLHHESLFFLLNLIYGLRLMSMNCYHYSAKLKRKHTKIYHFQIINKYIFYLAAPLPKNRERKKPKNKWKKRTLWRCCIMNKCCLIFRFCMYIPFVYRIYFVTIFVVLFFVAFIRFNVFLLHSFFLSISR